MTQILVGLIICALGPLIIGSVRGTTDILSAYQQCMICTSEKRVFNVDLQTNQTTCTVLMGYDERMMSISKADICQTLNTPSIPTQPLVAETNLSQVVNSSQSPPAQQLTVTCNCTTSAPAPMESPVLSLYEQCVICTGTKRHFGINIETHRLECRWAIGRADVFVVTDTERCKVFAPNRS